MSMYPIIPGPIFCFSIRPPLPPQPETKVRDAKQWLLSNISQRNRVQLQLKHHEKEWANTRNSARVTHKHAGQTIEARLRPTGTNYVLSFPQPPTLNVLRMPVPAGEASETEFQVTFLFQPPEADCLTFDEVIPWILSIFDSIEGIHELRAIAPTGQTMNDGDSISGLYRLRIELASGLPIIPLRGRDGPQQPPVGAQQLLVGAQYPFVVQQPPIRPQPPLVVPISIEYFTFL